MLYVNHISYDTVSINTLLYKTILYHIMQYNIVSFDKMSWYYNKILHNIIPNCDKKNKFLKTLKTLLNCFSTMNCE